MEDFSQTGRQADTGTLSRAVYTVTTATTKTTPPKSSREPAFKRLSSAAAIIITQRARVCLVATLPARVSSKPAASQPAHDGLCRKQMSETGLAHN